jgi:methionyl-tRNA synthetase
MKRFYLTTAIDYANGAPHLGHAYEKVLTDVIARSQRLLGKDVHFLTGIDEHGQKVLQTAQAQGKTPAQLVDELAPLFRELCTALNISNDDFIRTTEDRHKSVVQAILQQLFDKGDIYRGEYRGFYSVRQEQFVLAKERLEDGSWPEIYGEVVEIAEPNYFFRLSAYQPWLIDYLREHALVFPFFRQKQVVEFLKEPVNDLCISRPADRLPWGIPLPFDNQFVTYVWFDALINYISAVGYGTPRFAEFWPVDYHVIGKDILVPAHAVYWPAMLKAMGVEPPRGLLVHGWWHLGGQKMSKSSGVRINPIEFAARYGADALRYFMTREMNVGQDSDFTIELFLARYQADLANNLGNLVSRLLNLANKHCASGLPSAGPVGDAEQTVIDHWQATAQPVVDDFANFQFHAALEKVMTFVTALNRYAEIRAPWKLCKSADPADAALFATSMATLAEGIRLANCALLPVMPETAAKICGLLGEPVPTLWGDLLSWSCRLDGRVLGEKTILFPRPEPLDIA